jgi:hypothetical protein
MANLYSHPPFPHSLGETVQSVSPDRTLDECPARQNSLHASFGDQDRDGTVQHADLGNSISNGSGFVTISPIPRPLRRRTSTLRAWTDDAKSIPSHTGATFFEKQQQQPERCSLPAEQAQPHDVVVAGDRNDARRCRVDAAQYIFRQTRLGASPGVLQSTRPRASVVEAHFFLEEREGLTGGRQSVGHRLTMQ